MIETRDYKLDEYSSYANICKFRQTCKKYGIIEAYSNREDLFINTHYFDNTKVYLIIERDNINSITKCADCIKNILIPLYNNVFCSNEFTRCCTFNVSVVYKDEYFYNDIIVGNKELFKVNLN